MGVGYEVLHGSQGGVGTKHYPLRGFLYHPAPAITGAGGTED